MQKKVLMSLLATASVTFPAVANIDLPYLSEADWTKGGLAGNDFEVNKENGLLGITCPISGGYAQTTLKDSHILLKGIYKIEFAGEPTNLAVKINGKSVEDLTEGFAADGNTEIRFEAADAAKGGFEFSGAKLVLVVDFEDIAEKLTGQRKKIIQNIAISISGLDENQATEYKKQQQALIDTLNVCTNEISEIRGAGSLEADAALGIYKTYELWKPTEKINETDKNDVLNKVASELAEISDKVDALKAEIEATKTQNAVDAANAALKATLDQEVSRLLGDIKNYTEETVAKSGSEYAKDIYDKAIEDLNGELESYREKINAAFKDVKTEVAFPSEIAGYQTTFDDIKTAFDKNLADENAYADAVKIRASLEGVYAAAKTQIEGIAPVTDYPTDIYEKQREAWLASILDDYKNATESLSKMNLDAKTPEGAAELWKGDGTADNPGVEAEVNGYSSSIKTTGENAAKFATDWNAGYVEYMKDFVTPRNNKLNEAKKMLPTNLPSEPKAWEDLNNSLDDLVKKTENDITELENLIKLRYESQKDNVPPTESNWEDYPIDILDADDLVGEDLIKLNDMISGIQGVIDAQNNLTTTFEGIKGEVTIDDVKYSVQDRFEAAKNNIQASITKIVEDYLAGTAVTESVLEEVNRDISKMGDNAEKLSENFTKIENAVIGAEMLLAGDENGFKAYTEKKLEILKGFSKDFTATEAEAFKNQFISGVEADVETIKQAFIEAYNKDDQSCYEATNAIVAGENFKTADQFKSDINRAKADFSLKALTEYNAYCSIRKDNVYKVWTDYVAEEGNENAPVGTIDVQKGNIEKEIDSTSQTLTVIGSMLPEGKDVDESTLNTANKILNGTGEEDQEGLYSSNCKNIDSAIDTLEDIAIPAQIANHNNYKILCGLLEGVQTGVDEAVAANEKWSVTPAYEFFEGLIKAINEGDASKYQALKDKIDTAWTASQINETKKQELEGEIKGLASDVTPLAKRIRDNALAYKEQLNRSDEVRTILENAVSTLKNRAEKSGIDPETDKECQDWISEINGLRDKDLMDVNSQVLGSYAEGDCAEDNDANMQAYQDILDKLAEIQIQIDAKYPDIISSSNNATFDEVIKWDGIKNGLLDAYKDAVNTYDQYRFPETENKGYQEEASKIIKTHERVFDYYDEIIALDKEVIAWKDGNTQNEKLITLEAYTEKFGEAVSTLENGIKIEEEKIISEMTDCAKAYWNARYTALASVLGEAGRKLDAAGVEDEFVPLALVAARQALTDAEDLYIAADRVNEETTPGYLAVRMDVIADELDKAEVSEETVAGYLQTAAQNSWNNAYTEALNTVQILIANLGDATIFDKVKEDAKELAKETIEHVKNSEIVPLNTTAKADSELISTLAGYKSDLAEMMRAVQQIYDKLKADNDELKVIDEAFAEYTQSLEDLKSQLDALEDYRDSFAAASSVGEFTDILNAISALETKIKDKPNILTNKSDIETAIGDIETSIEAKYLDVQQAEKNKLERMLADVKTSWDTLNVKDENEAKKYLETVKEKDATYKALSEMLQIRPVDKDKFRDDARQLESELSDLLVTLDTALNPDTNPAYAAKNALEELYASVSKAIASAVAPSEGDSPWLQDEKVVETAGKISALQGELDGLQTKWDAEGNNIVATQANYAAAVNTIVKNLETLSQNLSDAIESAKTVYEKNQKSDELYAAFKADLETLKTSINLAKDLVADYGYSETEPFASDIQGITDAISALETKITETGDAHLFTDETEFTEFETIAGDIEDLRYDAAEKKFRDEYNNAQSALNAAAEYLGTPGVQFIDYSDLSAQLETLRSTRNTLNTDFYHWDRTQEEAFVAIEALIARAQALAESADSLKESAQEAEYVPGDVYAQDGSVDAMDLAQMMRWTLDNVSVDDLSKWERAAGDLNTNGRIDIADFSAVVNIMNGKDATLARVSMRMPQAEGPGFMSLQAVEEGNGVTVYALNLNNSVALANGIVELELPAGVSFENASLADRTSDHQIQIKETAGSVRIMIVSNTNSALKGNDGTILNLEVRGSNAPVLVSGEFADSNAVLYRIETATPTGIDAIIDGAKDYGRRIYNAAGQAMKKIQKGINIIRHKDGKVTKEMRNK